MRNFFFLIMGIGFGFVLIVSGVSNFDVIFDMFLFKSFHMYGLLGTTLAIMFTAIWILKKLQWKGVLTKEPLNFPTANPTKAHVVGGLLAGLGWGFTGACPGPALAQVGFGSLSGLFTVIGVFLGVYIFGLIKSRK